MSLFNLTRTKTSNRYAKENDREKRERRREIEKGRSQERHREEGRDKKEREREICKGYIERE